MAEPVVIESYVEDRWVAGEGEGAPLVNPATGEVLATASTTGIDLGAALAIAREVGGPALRALGFAQRAAILKTLAGIIHEHRDELHRRRDRATAATREATPSSTSTAPAARSPSTPTSAARLGEARVPRRRRDGAARPHARASSASTCGCRGAASRCSSTPSTSRPGASPRRSPARCSPACR